MNGLSFSIVVLFGVFLIWSGFMMFFRPEKVKKIIAAAGSTYFINYTELIIRFFIGLAFINVQSKQEVVYSIFGYFLICSALILMVVPIKLHNGFSVKASTMLKPLFLKIVSPITVMIGLLVIYGII